MRPDEDGDEIWYDETKITDANDLEFLQHAFTLLCKNHFRQKLGPGRKGQRRRGGRRAQAGRALSTAAPVPIHGDLAWLGERHLSLPR